MPDEAGRTLQDEPPVAWVETADGDRVVLRRRSLRGWRLVRRLTGRPLARSIVVADEHEKATALDRARNLGLPFRTAPHGWPPDAVALHLRDAGLLDGRWDTVTYDGGHYRWYAFD